ncbi:unnamed protein product [Oreochromis niloticus]|nr:unnamed protein product [Mustela putorius furo]CAI5645026.1 unnamed protein product [Mustela putorius furo]
MSPQKHQKRQNASLSSLCSVDLQNKIKRAEEEILGLQEKCIEMEAQIKRQPDIKIINEGWGIKFGEARNKICFLKKGCKKHMGLLQQGYDKLDANDATIEKLEEELEHTHKINEELQENLYKALEKNREILQQKEEQDMQCKLKDIEEKYRESTMAEFQTVVSVLITPENILPAVSECFNRFSRVQWGTIEHGVWDSDLQAALADMITEIIQTVSTGILNSALPVVQKFMTHVSQTDISIPVVKIAPSLGDSLSMSIAISLNIPHDKYESIKTLTKLIEMEISEKVNSAVTLLLNNPDLRSDPAVYVSGKITCIKNLRRMVSHAASYLKRCAGKLSCLCMRKGASSSSPSPSDSSAESTKSKIRERVTLDEVSIALTKWSTDAAITEDKMESLTKVIAADAVNKILDNLNYLAEDATGIEQCTDAVAAESLQPPSTPEEIAAADIVNTVIDNLQSSDGEDVTSSNKCGSCKPFNVQLIIQKVKNFFASCIPPLKTNEQKLHKDHFCSFAKKQFYKVIREIKHLVKKNKRFFICLQDPVKSPDNQRADSMDSYSSFCRYVNTPTMHTRFKSSSSVDFTSFNPYLDQLFNKLKQTKHLNLIQKPMENVNAFVEVETFCRELTDKIYDHLQSTQRYSLPVMLLGRSLSDSVISRSPEPTGELPFSPEVLYVTVEDSVQKFLQNILLWLENDALDETVQSDKVSGAVEDIQDVILRALTPTEQRECDRLCEPESSPVSPHKNQPISCVSVLEQDLPPEKSPEPEPVADTGPTEGQSQPSISKNLQEEPSEFFISPFAAEKIAKDFSAVLLPSLLEKCSFDTRKTVNTEKRKAITRRLTHLVLDNVRSSEYLSALENNKLQIVKKMTKALRKELGSLDQFVHSVLTPDDSTFAQLFLAHLEIIIEVVLNPPMKSKIARFFRAVGKALMKPFSCCFKGSSDD